MFAAASIKAVEPEFIVAKDGSGDFTVIQQALNAIKDDERYKTSDLYKEWYL